MTCRVPVPVHVNNLGTPREHTAPQVPVAVLPNTNGNLEQQPSADSSHHMCRLLSLPSFGKVVYKSNNFGAFNAALSKQRSLPSPAAKSVGAIDSQQMLLQGHASPAGRLPSLEFDSQFESGNLQKAVQASNTACIYSLEVQVFSEHVDRAGLSCLISFCILCVAAQQLTCLSRKRPTLPSPAALASCTAESQSICIAAALFSFTVTHICFIQSDQCRTFTGLLDRCQVRSMNCGCLQIAAPMGTPSGTSSALPMVSLEYSIGCTSTTSGKPTACTAKAYSHCCTLPSKPPSQ